MVRQALLLAGQQPKQQGDVGGSALMCCQMYIVRASVAM
jgi:hypothetical protein